MVNLHFPPNLTEEELMLQTKYEKLRKKKKALENHKSPKVEAERPVIKRPKIEAKNAKEIAKKLLKSGAIGAIQKTQRREDQGSGFKRPCGLERKLERSSNASYQPFSSGLELEDKPAVKKLYSSSDDIRDPIPMKISRPSPVVTSPPKPRNTIFVSVGNSSDQKLDKELLTSTFSTYGGIINITLEGEKNRAFVSFDSDKAASQALQLDGAMVGSFLFKVTYSRRQDKYKPPATDSSSPLWSSGQGGPKDDAGEGRNLVIYDEELFQ